ncbi:hypothetical protein LEMLEM_LOCUS22044, partial [Lemmus lemmus]
GYLGEAGVFSGAVTLLGKEEHGWVWHPASLPSATPRGKILGSDYLSSSSGFYALSPWLWMSSRHHQSWRRCPQRRASRLRLHLPACSLEHTRVGRLREENTLMKRKRESVMRPGESGDLGGREEDPRWTLEVLQMDPMDLYIPLCFMSTCCPALRIRG